MLEVCAYSLSAPTRIVHVISNLSSGHVNLIHVLSISSRLDGRSSRWALQISNGESSSGCHPPVSSEKLAPNSLLTFHDSGSALQVGAPIFLFQYKGSPDLASGSPASPANLFSDSLLTSRTEL